MVSGYAIKGFADALDKRDQNKFAQEQFDLKKDELALNRRLSLINTFYDKRKSALKPTKGYEDNVMIESNLYLNDLVAKSVENNEYDDTTKNFITKVQNDPYAVVDLVKFLKSQASDKNRIFKLSDLPTIVSIIDNPNQTKKEKFNLFKELELADLKNEDDFIDLYTKVMNIDTNDFGSRRNIFITTPLETKIDPKESIDLSSTQLNEITKLIVSQARIYTINNPDANNEKSRETEAALKNINSSEPAVKENARSILFNYYLTVPFVDQVLVDPQFKDLKNKLSFNSLLKNSQGTRKEVLVNDVMARKDSRLSEYIGQKIFFYYGGNGIYYPNI
tara:strand:- start:1854 stop:2855 length:1002 start_codon:yes stop_codon:yes gene_type:complete